MSSLPVEAHERAAVADRVEEAVVLFARHARERLEPMRVVRGAVLDGPFLHGMRHDVGHFDVERLSPLDGAHERLVRDGRQPFCHHVFVEHQRSVDIGHVRRHERFLPLKMLPHIIPQTTSHVQRPIAELAGTRSGEVEYDISEGGSARRGHSTNERGPPGPR